MKTSRRALLAGAAALSAGHEAAAAKGGKTAAHPNFVVVVADDMRETDWRALSGTRKLLRDAAFYPNFYFNTPLCDPSRASLLTGMYAHNHGILWNMRDGRNSSYAIYKRNNLERRSIPFLLQQAGYRTGMVGKFLNTSQTIGDRPLGWDSWISTPVIRYTDFPLDIEGQVTEFTSGEYVTDTLADYACEFVRSTPPEQPLFMLFGSNAPHTGPANSAPIPARRHRRLYADAQVTRTASYNEADMSDKPAGVSELPLLTEAQMAAGDALERSRLQSLAALDEAIVAIANELRANGRLDNTVFLITSDNGFQMGQHRMMNLKAVPYQESMRVPLLAWGSAFNAGTNPRLISNIDLAPTIAQLAGVRMADADGVSLLARLSRDVVLSQFSPPTPSPTTGVGLHTIRYSYVEYTSGDREFYDLRTDAMQLSNLLPPAPISPPPLPTDLPTPADLSARLATLKSCRGASCR